MKSRVGLPAVITAIGAASILLLLARPACADPGQDAKEPGTPPAPATEAEVPPPAPVTEAEAPPAAPATEPEVPPAVPPPASTLAVVGDRVSRVLGNDRAWGVALRARYVSVPGWLLGFFTQHNMPLGTWGHWGIEGFRRLGHLQITAGFSYQNMSPPDGNWLGKGHTAETDTRFLQFRGLSLYSADVAFTGGGMLSSWFGLHAGAGLGLAVVHGSVYVNNSINCTDANIGDLNQCHPPGVTCANGVCTPVSALSTKPNGDVLPILPIVDVLVGMDFRLPDVKGWEAKLEGGFFDAFFFGVGVGYTF